MTIHIISQNPYRILGVLSSSPLKERVGNQNRLAAFAKVGKEVVFPNDFAAILEEKPDRSPESISSANSAINLDKDQLKYALFWFISGNPMDDMALKYLQAGNIEKAKEIFQKKESFASLINSGVLAFIENDVATGFSNVSKVIHNAQYRSEFLQTLNLTNLSIDEGTLSALYIAELLKKVPASRLLSAATSAEDKALIGKHALEEPLSIISSAVAVAKAVPTNDANANLAAGKKLMNSTKEALKKVREIAGASSSQYQMAADSLAKQILQSGINYYNNAPDTDYESPRKAMELQAYALSIAVGKLTKDRCQENYNIIKKTVDNMPPAAVALEARKVVDELRKFCNLPDKISHSITLLNNTKPLLQTIKTKLGATNSFYLQLSTQVVGNALHNLIEEVNQVQNRFSAMVSALKAKGLDPALLNYLGDSLSPAKIIDTQVKPVAREAWRATQIMDTFDMEPEFKTKRYNPNRQSLKEMCDSLGISTSSYRPTTTRTTSTTRSNTTTTRPTTSGSSSSDDGLPIGCWVVIVIAIIIFICNVL